MKQPTDAKTIDGPISSLGTYIDLQLALSDALGDRLHRTSTGASAVCHAAPAELHAALAWNQLSTKVEPRGPGRREVQLEARVHGPPTGAPPRACGSRSCP